MSEIDQIKQNEQDELYRKIEKNKGDLRMAELFNRLKEAGYNIEIVEPDGDSAQSHCGTACKILKPSDAMVISKLMKIFPWIGDAVKSHWHCWETK